MGAGRSKRLLPASLRRADFEAALGVNLFNSVERETSPADGHRRCLPSKLQWQVHVVGEVKGLVNLGKRGFDRVGSDSSLVASSVQKRLSRFGTTRSSFLACACLKDVGSGGCAPWVFPARPNAPFLDEVPSLKDPRGAKSRWLPQPKVGVASEKETFRRNLEHKSRLKEILISRSRVQVKRIKRGFGAGRLHFLAHHSRYERENSSMLA